MCEVSTVQQRRHHQYPGVAEAERQRSNYNRTVDDEPDILHTTGGFCPNYEKFYRMGYKDDYEILCRCNLD
ncbi:MAG: hypothetical protein IJ883_06055 [Eubacterium sp.]|nr:hypothetical protein [Eubacterium sp.]